MNLELSSSQKKTAGIALTLLSVTVIILFVAAILWLVAKFLTIFSSVLLPLGVAGVLALLLKPLFNFYSKYMNPILSLTCTFLSVLIPIGGFIAMFGVVIVEQLGQLIRQIPVWVGAMQTGLVDVMPHVATFIEKYGLAEKLRTALENNASLLVQKLVAYVGSFAEAGSAILGSLGSLFAWAVMPVYLAFLLLIKPENQIKLADYLPFLKESTRDDVVYLVNEFVGILVSFFRGQLVIALIQAVLFALGFSLVGLQYGLLIGLALGFLNIIPYLGSIVGLTVALPLAYFQPDGGFVLFALVIAVFSAVQAIEGYVLTPKIMGDQTGLHPMVIIVAVFFWGVAAGGIVGMLFAIPFTAFFVVFWRLARNKYIKEIL